MLDVIEQLIEEELMLLDEKKRKRGRVNPNYLKGSPQKRKRAEEIKARAKTDDDDPSAYRPFATDKNPKTGKQIKTKTSRWTKKFKKMYGESMDEIDDIEDLLEYDLVENDSADFDVELLREFIEEILEEEKKKKPNSAKALKNKAKSARAPLGALRSIYNKGLAAWRTGHRPGAGQHQWAMARVNSVLAGGPARKVDSAQWKQIQKFRKRRKKK